MDGVCGSEDSPATERLLEFSRHQSAAILWFTLVLLVDVDPSGRGRSFHSLDEGLFPILSFP